jgi:5-methylcytosine-specific restriction endonuclease McrA
MRDYNSDEYKSFLKKVKQRDKYQCKMCGCKKKLQVHHILEWSENPHLRYEVTNGITLCVECHKSIRYHEKTWALYLSNLI